MAERTIEQTTRTMPLAPKTIAAYTRGPVWHIFITSSLFNVGSTSCDSSKQNVLEIETTLIRRSGTQIQLSGQISSENWNCFNSFVQLYSPYGGLVQYIAGFTRE